MKANNLKIEKLDDFGRGISYFNDKIIFIDNALPNEIVDVEITRDNSKYYKGIVTNYIKTVQERIKPICPYYNKCGGCHLMHLSYEEQLIYKKSKVEETIKKFCKKENVVKDIIYDKSTNYRNKVVFKVNKAIGFYENNTNNIVPIDYCYLVDEKINKLIKLINEKINLSNIYEIMVRTAKNDTMIVFYGTNFDTNDLLQLKNDVSSIYVYNTKYEKIYGKKKIKEQLKKLEFFISPDAFFQVNPKMCIKMYDKIASLIKKSDVLLDLYCGVGSIGLYVSNKCKEVIGVEINEDSIKNANDNKKENNINNITFYHGKTCEILQKLKRKIDYIIIDPPRSGLDLKTIELINNSNTKNIIYVSCDLMTLVRDINLLKEKYELLETTPIDMFPNTYHIESISVLIKK